MAETRLLEIMKYGLKLEHSRNETIYRKFIQWNYIRSKKRKTELMTAIIDYFSKRKEKIECRGKKLIDLQKIAEKNRSFSKRF